MYYQVKNAVRAWSYEINQYVRDEVMDLEPHEYCVGAVFVIAIGFVLLSGRR